VLDEAEHGPGEPLRLVEGQHQLTRVDLDGVPDNPQRVVVTGVDLIPLSRLDGVRPQSAVVVGHLHRPR